MWMHYLNGLYKYCCSSWWFLFWMVATTMPLSYQLDNKPFKRSHFISTIHEWTYLSQGSDSIWNIRYPLMCWISWINKPPQLTHVGNTWMSKLHEVEKVDANQLGLTKYKCPCAFCYGGGRHVLWTTIRGHVERYGHDCAFIKPLVV